VLRSKAPPGGNYGQSSDSSQEAEEDQENWDAEMTHEEIEDKINEMERKLARDIAEAANKGEQWAIDWIKTFYGDK